ncbi:hypothetical protein HZ996_11850 [Cryomorphaceae bacterium]|nr:hypothetical protein HZ996_11850 [Cryomorphaceae bacterium]
MIIQVIKLRSDLSEEELLRRANERAPRFEALEGLLQKYYVRLEEHGMYGGIYIWDNVESMVKFRGSELAQSIPGAYEIKGPPQIELMNVLFQLRD